MGQYISSDTMPLCNIPNEEVDKLVVVKLLPSVLSVVEEISGVEEVIILKVV